MADPELLKFSPRVTALVSTHSKTTRKKTMTDQIKAQILQLPDEEIKPLLEWLTNYYDGDVWDRQMVADIERLGEVEWMRRLSQPVEDDGGRRAAILRLMNSQEPTTEEKRQQFLTDLFLAVGQPAADFLEKPVEGSTEGLPV